MRHAGTIAVLAALGLVAPVRAQGPFVFTVTTTPPSATERWTAQYDVGYADRTAAPFGYDGLEQRARIQGSLGSGFTVVGEVGLGIDGQSTTSTTQHLEALKDILGGKHGLQLAGGLGVRREWQGTTVFLGRVAFGHAFPRSSVFGNFRFEKPLAADRDRLDLITSLGWLHRVGGSLRVGLEAMGEDLEGLWDAEEAEGGAKLFLGPSVHLAPSRSPLYASLCGGPIVYATHSGRTSVAARPLGATGNGYTLRLTVGYRF
jgi:hypothetical protein